MNKRKIEKEIKNNLNISNNFEKIKNKIDFDKYTEKVKDAQINFENKWWKLAIISCFTLIIISFYLGELSPQLNMTKPSTGENNSFNNSSQFISKVESGTSEYVSTIITSASAPNDDTDFKQSGAGMINNYTEENGYFEYNNIGYQSYALIDVNKEYNINETIEVIIYLGTSKTDVESFATSIIMSDYSSECEKIVLEDISEFSYLNYPLDEQEDNGIKYTYIKKNVLVKIDLSLLSCNEGIVYIGLNKDDNLNYQEHGVLGSEYHYQKTEEKIKFSKEIN